VSVGEGGSEKSRQADGGDGKNIFRMAETAGVVSGGLDAGGVSNVGNVGGANLRGKGDGRNIFRRAQTAGADGKRDRESEGKWGDEEKCRRRSGRAR
jgi:hypothetical protein